MSTINRYLSSVNAVMVAKYHCLREKAFVCVQTTNTFVSGRARLIETCKWDCFIAKPRESAKGSLSAPVDINAALWAESEVR